METLHLYVSVPVAGFRVAQAREFWETYPLPPPSTVYGMLLSLIGEENRLVHQGAQIAVALVSEPSRSVVIRTLWRVKSPKLGPGQGNNACPGYQELLSDIRLSVWIRKGEQDQSSELLMNRLGKALSNPSSVKRYGGLCLGESTHLVDEVRGWRSSDPVQGQLLVRDRQGDLTLPIWPDHVGSKGTSWEQFSLREKVNINYGEPPSEDAWVAIQPMKANS